MRERDAPVLVEEFREVRINNAEWHSTVRKRVVAEDLRGIGILPEVDHRVSAHVERAFGIRCLSRPSLKP